MSYKKYPATVNFAKQPADIPAVNVDELEQVVLLVFSSIQPSKNQPKGGDTLLHGAELADTLDTSFDAVKTDVDTFAALFERAIALYNFCSKHNFCSKEQPPRELMLNGIPGRILCTAASTAPMFRVPGATQNIVTYDFDRMEMFKAIDNAIEASPR